MKKRIALLVTAVVLCAAVTVGATLAYLWDDAGKAVNTFGVGGVEAELKEDFYTPGEGSDVTPVKDNDLKLLPGTEFGKNPYVTLNKDSEKAYVYIKVDCNVNLADYFSDFPGIAADWTELLDADSKGLGIYRAVFEAEDVKYLYADDDFVVDGNLTQLEGARETGKFYIDDLKDMKITYSGYAIQFDNITEAAADAEAVNFFA